MSRQMKPLDLGAYGSGNPVIVAEFSDRWRRQSYRKRASRSWLLKLRKKGVTHVTLDIEGRGHVCHADFALDELVRSTASARHARIPVATKRLTGGDRSAHAKCRCGWVAVWPRTQAEAADAYRAHKRQADETSHDKAEG